MVPEGLRAKINKGSWPVLPIFNLLQNTGNIEETDMFNTFNMGIGMVLAVDSSIVQEVTAYLNKEFIQAYIIGELVKGEAGVELC